MKNTLTTMAAWTMETAAALVSAFPPALRFHLAAFFGRLYALWPNQQRATLRLNLRNLLKLDGSELAQRTNDIFRNFAITLYDFFVPDGITVDIPDRPMIEALRKKHGGILVLTFHMGNWELGARSMSQWGWPVTAVYQPYTNRKFKEMIEKRRAPGVNFVPVGRRAADGVRDALKRGDVVAMLGDHPFGEEGTPVAVLGHRIMWPKGPVLLAVREKKPIVVAVIIRTSPRHYRAYIEEALVPQNRSRQEVDRLVQDVATKFGTLLTRYSDQWYRFLPFEYVNQERRTKSEEPSTKL